MSKRQHVINLKNLLALREKYQLNSNGDGYRGIISFFNDIKDTTYQITFIDIGQIKEAIVELISHIASIHLFKDLPEEHLHNLSMILNDQVFRKGQLIFSEDDEATGFYVVITGRVKIFKLSLEGKEQILHIFGPGAPIGEVAVFEGKRFPANAEPLEDSRLFFFPINGFLKLIKENPSIALHMLAELSQRLRRFASLIDDLSLKEVPARLAAYLLYLSETQQKVENLSLEISKGQLSSVLGTVPETLSRILTKMSNAGLIRSEVPRGIRILDRNGLEDLACGKNRLY